MLVRPVVSKVFRRGRHFSVNEKDEASLLNCFQQDSSNAFIPRFPEFEGFFVALRRHDFKFRPGLSIQPAVMVHPDGH